MSFQVPFTNVNAHWSTAKKLNAQSRPIKVEKNESIGMNIGFPSGIELLRWNNPRYHRVPQQINTPDSKALFENGEIASSFSFIIYCMYAMVLNVYLSKTGVLMNVDGWYSSDSKSDELSILRQLLKLPISICHQSLSYLKYNNCEQKADRQNFASSDVRQVYSTSYPLLDTKRPIFSHQHCQMKGRLFWIVLWICIASHKAAVLLWNQFLLVQIQTIKTITTTISLLFVDTYSIFA